MDPSSDLVEHFRLPVEFLPGETQHTAHESSQSHGVRGIKVVKRWARKQDLGEGSFGIVRLEVEADGSKRAVKEVSKRLCVRNKINYEKELAALAKLTKYRDHFVQFLGWYENSDHIYMAMEYFVYGDLDQYISARIPEPQVKTIVLQILQGLQIMHQLGFTHRDLKPQNIFVLAKEPTWWVKIGDFGITKRITNENTFLKTEIGTRAYQAPEASGFGEEETSTYTNLVDIWSVGCICHQLLTLQLPFANLGKLGPYCWGKSGLPIETMSQDEASAESITFLKGVMAARPGERWSADSALQSPWLEAAVEEERDQGSLTRPTLGSCFVPPIVSTCIRAVEEFGSLKQDIYTRPGSPHDLARLGDIFNTNQKDFFIYRLPKSHNGDVEVVAGSTRYDSNIRVVAGVLKLFSRSLPNRLLHHPFVTYLIGTNIYRNTGLYERSLHSSKFATLEELVVHLRPIQLERKYNGMTFSVLANYFGPILIEGNDMGVKERAIDTFLIEDDDMGVKERTMEHILASTTLFAQGGEEEDKKELSQLFNNGKLA